MLIGPNVIIGRIPPLFSLISALTNITCPIQVYDIIRNKIANKKTIHESDWCKIEMIIDSVYPNFRNKLYCAYKIDKREYRMCILIKLGLRNSDIAIIMCRTKGAISLSRASMYEKVFKRKGTAKDFDDFIRHL